MWIDVAVTKMVSPALLSPGAAVTYTLAFSNLINAGPSVATGAVISDRIPLSVTITGVTSSTFGSGVWITQTSGAPNFAWALSDLAVGEGGVITLTGFLNPDATATGALITNTATITARDDLTPTNNSAAATFTVGIAACSATPNGGATVFASVDGQAVQSAIDAAGSGGTVKVAGRCVGAQSLAGTSQTGYISKSLTLRGGYTNTVASWAAAGDPAANPSTLDAAQAGRVLYITGAIDVAIQNLRLTGGGATAGGGVYNNAARTTISNTLIHSNSAASGGGMWNQSAGRVLIEASTVASNTANAGGGLLNEAAGQVTFDASAVAANMAAASGGGIYNTDSGSAVTLTNGSWAQANSAIVGAGLWNGFAGQVTLDASAVASNTASNIGGGINNTGGAITVTRGSLLGNSAANGGGIYQFAPSPGRIVNALFSRNAATFNGAAIYVLDAGPLSLIHTSIVSPTAPAGATNAVYVFAGTVRLTNTLIATHTIGIARAGGSVGDWNTLFADVATPYSGVVTSVDGITGTAGFVNPAADDYHLGAGSGAINAGIVAGVAVDIDGQARPQGGGFDIGYDESPFASLAPRAYLPFVVR